MAQALLSVIGFKPELVLEPAKHYGASEVHLLASPHSDVAAALKQTTAALEEDGVRVDVHRVRDAFDLVEWYLAWRRAFSSAIEVPVVNLTAGHGAAISAGCLLAIEHGLTTCLYDQLTGEHHGFSPRILLHLEDLTTTDRLILQKLVGGEDTVGGIAAGVGLGLSTASRALDRLRERGFCGERREGRSKINSLSPGVAQLLRRQPPPDR